MRKLKIQVDNKNKATNQELEFVLVLLTKCRKYGTIL